MNKINNLVHSSDEPWDVVRELAILLPEHELKAAWAAAAKRSRNCGFCAATAP